MERKRCTLCHKLKTLEEFYRDKSTSTGYTSACKPCRSRQVSRAESRRLKRSKGQVIEESSELLVHNEKTLERLLGESREAPNMTFRTRLVDAINSDPQGLRFLDGEALINTPRGIVSKDLSKVSIHDLARFLELYRIRIESKESVSV